MKITNRASNSSLQQLNLQSNSHTTRNELQNQALTMSNKKNNQTLRSSNQPQNNLDSKSNNEAQMRYDDDLNVSKKHHGVLVKTEHNSSLISNFAPHSSQHIHQFMKHMTQEGVIQHNADHNNQTRFSNDLVLLNSQHLMPIAVNSEKTMQHVDFQRLNQSHPQMLIHQSNAIGGDGTVESIPLQLQIKKDRSTHSASSVMDGIVNKKSGGQDDQSNVANLTSHSIDHLNSQFQAENLNNLKLNESQIQSAESKRQFIAIDDNSGQNQGGKNNTQPYPYMLSSSTHDELGDVDSQASALLYSAAHSQSKNQPYIMHGAQIAHIMSSNVNRSQLIQKSQNMRNECQQAMVSGQSLNKYIIESGMPIQGIESTHNRNDIDNILITSGQRAIQINTQGQGTLGLNIQGDSLPVDHVNQFDVATCPPQNPINHIENMTYHQPEQQAIEGPHEPQQQTASFHTKNQQSSQYLPSSLVTFNNTQGTGNILERERTSLGSQKNNQQVMSSFDRLKDGLPPSGKQQQQQQTAPYMLLLSQNQSHVHNNQSLSRDQQNYSSGQQSMQKYEEVNNYENRCQIQTPMDSQTKCNSLTLQQILFNVNEISKQLEQKQLLGSNWQRNSTAHLGGHQQSTSVHQEINNSCDDENLFQQASNQNQNNQPAPSSSNPQQSTLYHRISTVHDVAQQNTSATFPDPSHELKTDVKKLSGQIEVMSYQIDSIFKVLDLLNQFTSEQEQQNVTFKKRLGEFTKDASLFAKYAQHDAMVEKVSLLERGFKDIDLKLDSLGKELSRKYNVAEKDIQQQQRESQQRCTVLEEKIKMLNYGVNRDQRVLLAERIKSGNDSMDNANTMFQNQHQSFSFSHKNQMNTAIGEVEITPEGQSKNVLKIRLKSSGRTCSCTSKQANKGINSMPDFERRSHLKMQQSEHYMNHQTKTIDSYAQNPQNIKKELVSSRIKIKDDDDDVQSHEGPGQRSTSQKSGVLFEPNTARQTTISKTEQLTTRRQQLLEARNDKSRKYYHQRIQLESSSEDESSYSGLDETKEVGEVYIKDEGSIDSNKSEPYIEKKLTSALAQQSDILGNYSQLLSGDRRKNQIDSSGRHSGQQDGVQSPEFNQLVSITSRDNRPEIKNKVELGNYAALDKRDTVQAILASNTMNADLLSSYQSCNYKQQTQSNLVKSAYEGEFSQIENFGQSIVEKSTNNIAHGASTEQKHAKNRPSISDRVKLSHIINKGEETIVSMGPYDVILQGDSVEQFDNRKANESINQSLVHESVQNNTSQKSSIKSTGGKRAAPRCFRRNGRAVNKGGGKKAAVDQPKLMRKQGSAAHLKDKAFVDLQNKYREAKQQLMKIQENKGDTRSDRMWAESRLQTSQSQKRPATPKEYNNSTRYSKSHSPSNHNPHEPGQSLKHANYKLHCAITNPRDKSDNSNERSHHDYLHYDYLSEEIQDALRYTQRKIELQRNMQPAATSSDHQRRYPTFNEQGRAQAHQPYERERSARAAEEYHRRAQPNEYLDRREMLINEEFVAPQRSISFDHDVQYGRQWGHAPLVDNYHDVGARQRPSRGDYTNVQRSPGDLAIDSKFSHRNRNMFSQFHDTPLMNDQRFNKGTHAPNHRMISSTRKAKSVNQFDRDHRVLKKKPLQQRYTMNHRPVVTKQSSLRDFRFARIQHKSLSANGRRTNRLSAGLSNSKHRNFQRINKSFAGKLGKRLSKKYLPQRASHSPIDLGKKYGLRRESVSNKDKRRKILIGRKKKNQSHNQGLNNIEKQNLKKMRNNLLPYKQSFLKGADSATPKNIQVALNQSREYSNNELQGLGSPSDQQNRTAFLERANSDLLEEFPDTQIVVDKQLNGGRDGAGADLQGTIEEEDATGTNDSIAQRSKSRNNQTHPTPSVVLDESSEPTDLSALNTYEKVDVLQKDIDHLKSKIVSQKASKLKREIKALKQQLNNSVYTKQGTGAQPTKRRYKEKL